jgi:hypothetical protein
MQNYDSGLKNIEITGNAKERFWVNLESWGLEVISSFIFSYGLCRRPDYCSYTCFLWTQMFGEHQII